MTTPRDITAARDRIQTAGAALRARPGERTLDSLARVLDSWSAPDSVWQARLVEALPEVTGFSKPNLREGLAVGLRGWTGDALRRLAARELSALGDGTIANGFESTHVILAGSIPMPTILSLLAPLLLHSPVLAKTASRDPVTATLFRESLGEADPELASALEVVHFSADDAACRAAFLDAPCVVATGSDETVARIEREARAKRPALRCVGYGHRVSVAVLGPAALTPEAAAGVARDTVRWDQLGCLSPIATFLVGASPMDAERFARDLAGALAADEERAPRGTIAPAAAAVFRAERDAAEMRRAAGADLTLHADPSLRWTVVREPDAELRPAPLHRFLRVHTVADLAALEVALVPLSAYLAGVALAGFGASHDEVTRRLATLGASRICPPGQLQTPPLGWHHDNLPLLPPIARLCDVETRAPGADAQERIR